MSADLHIHTTFSDGTYPPEKIIELAKKVGLKTISITDHDVVDGIEPARRAGELIGVEVIPGIEFTTELSNIEIHILGYFIDYKLSDLADVLNKIQNDRVARIYKIVEKLKNIGVKINPESIFEIAGHGSVGRPHVARALIQAGYVGSVREAFERYLNYGAPAYVSHFKLLPEEAIKLVRKIGGVPVFAHPAISNCDEIIPDLISAGLLGLEVYYPSHSKNNEIHYFSLAKKYNLLVTGGSDFHGIGSFREVELGDVIIDDTLVEKMKKAKEEILR